MIKLTDCLAKFFIVNGSKRAFGLQGGAVVHIFDSLEKYKVNVTYNHHEGSSALAGVACSKLIPKPSLVVVTSGPGGTNAITGLLAAWQDSIPCIFISGQVRTDHVSYGKKVRQIGTQESKIVDIVKAITKKSTYVKNKDDFYNVLKESYITAISGRPGPVWIDIPLNLQWELIKEPKNYSIPSIQKIKSKHNYKKFINNFNTSKKPLLILGYGLWLSGKLDEYLKIINEKKYKFVTTWTALDYMPTNFKNNLGIIGMRGQRGANKAVFESDFILCLGTHLGIPHTTTLTENYAPNSQKAIVNIDDDQLKNLNIKFDYKFNESLENFIPIFKKLSKPSIDDYVGLKKLNWYKQKSKVKPNSNIFYYNLTKKSPKKSCFVVDGGGTALYTGFQSLNIKKGQRVICSSGMSSMGTGLAETIGAFKSGLFKKIYCIIGDGSFLMNIQDLQNIKSENIPAVIIVVNNNGYLAIRQTQEGFLNNKYYGTHPEWSLKMPNIEKISKGFGFDFIKINKSKDIDSGIKKLNNYTKPVICELVVSETQGEIFRQKYHIGETNYPLPLSEMWPY